MDFPAKFWRNISNSCEEMMKLWESRWSAERMWWRSCSWRKGSLNSSDGGLRSHGFYFHLTAWRTESAARKLDPPARSIWLRGGRTGLREKEMDEMKIGASFSFAAGAASENTGHHLDHEKNVSHPAQRLRLVDHSSKNKLNGEVVSAAMDSAFVFLSELLSNLQKQSSSMDVAGSSPWHRSADLLVGSQMGNCACGQSRGQWTTHVYKEAKNTNVSLKNPFWARNLFLFVILSLFLTVSTAENHRKCLDDAADARSSHAYR